MPDPRILMSFLRQAIVLAAVGTLIAACGGAGGSGAASGSAATARLGGGLRSNGDGHRGREPERQRGDHFGRRVGVGVQDRPRDQECSSRIA